MNSPGTPYQILRLDVTPSHGNGAGASGSPRNQGSVSTRVWDSEGSDGEGAQGSPDIRPLSAPFDGAGLGPISHAPMTPQPRRMGRGPSRCGPLWRPSPRNPPGGAGVGVKSPGTPPRSPQANAAPSPGNRAGAAGSQRNWRPKAGFGPNASRCAAPLVGRSTL